MKSIKQLIFLILLSLSTSLWAANQNPEKHYTGDKLSLNFQNIPVRSVLNIIAEFTGLNIVASDSVKGQITVHLNNVPWDEALDIILKTQGLSELQLGKVLLIAPSDEIAKRQQAELSAQLQKQAMEPLDSVLISLNYAEASEVSSILKNKSNSLLSARGVVTVDKRTNALLIEDTQERINEVQNLIKKLDIPVKQVLIEARIVEVSRDFERTLGIHWNIANKTPLTGKDHPQNPLRGKVPVDDANASSLTHLNINLPAQPTSGEPATVGLALANLGHGYLLDLELSALESEGQGELISSPRLVTADQQEAFIEAGEEIPYQEASSSGATTVAFQQATLKLDVTPHITPDNNIIMAIKVNQDKPNAALDVQGTPAITTRKIDTKVRVANGETVVLGGIYRQEKTRSILRVPFLGEIPMLGALFRSTKVTDSNSELLIFITPRIVQPDNFDR